MINFITFIIIFLKKLKLLQLIKIFKKKKIKILLLIRIFIIIGKIALTFIKNYCNFFHSISPFFLILLNKYSYDSKANSKHFYFFIGTIAKYSQHFCHSTIELSHGMMEICEAEKEIHSKFIR